MEILDERLTNRQDEIQGEHDVLMLNKWVHPNTWTTFQRDFARVIKSAV